METLGIGKEFEIPKRTEAGAKLTMCICTLLLLLTSILVRAHSFSETVSLEVKNTPLEKVFAEIRKQTGYSFAYYESELTKAKPVSIKVSNAQLAAVLTTIFKNQPLTYTVVEKVVLVREKAKKGIAALTLEWALTPAWA